MQRVGVEKNRVAWLELAVQTLASGSLRKLHTLRVCPVLLRNPGLPLALALACRAKASAVNDRAVIEAPEATRALQHLEAAVVACGAVQGDHAAAHVRIHRVVFVPVTICETHTRDTDAESDYRIQSKEENHREEAMAPRSVAHSLGATPSGCRGPLRCPPQTGPPS
jgi:hypothetical protein